MILFIMIRNPCANMNLIFNISFKLNKDKHGRFIGDCPAACFLLRIIINSYARIIYNI